jgi:hypothetical protein
MAWHHIPEGSERETLKILQFEDCRPVHCCKYFNENLPYISSVTLPGMVLR